MENAPRSTPPPNSVDLAPPTEVSIGNRILSSAVDLYLFCVFFLVVWGFWAFLVPDQGPFPESRAAFFLRDGRDFALAVGPLRFVSVASAPTYLCFALAALFAGSGVLPGHRLFAAKVAKNDGGVPTRQDRFAREFLRAYALLSVPAMLITMLPILVLLASLGTRGRSGGFPVLGSLPGSVETIGMAILAWNAVVHIFGGKLLHDRLSGTILVRDPAAGTRPRRALRGLLDLLLVPIAFLAFYAAAVFIWGQLC